MKKFILITLIILSIICSVSYAQAEEVTIPKGTSFSAVLQSTISSRAVSTGENIAAYLDKDWVYEGNVVAPAGSLIYAEIAKTNSAGKAMKNGEIDIRFTELETPTGDVYDIVTNNYVVKVKQSRAWEIVKNVSTYIIAGQGLLNAQEIDSRAGNDYASMAQSFGSGDVTKGAIAGLIFGVMDTQEGHEGQDVALAAGTKFTLRLVEPLIITNNIPLDTHHDQKTDAEFYVNEYKILY